MNINRQQRLARRQAYTTYIKLLRHMDKSVEAWLSGDDKLADKHNKIHAGLYQRIGGLLTKGVLING